MLNEPPSPPQPGQPAALPQPDWLTRKLTLKQVLLYGGIGLIFMALVLGVYSGLEREMSRQASPLRVPSEPSPTGYSVVENPRKHGLTGEALAVEGMLVAANFPFRDMPRIWIAGDDLGVDPDSGLPYAIPLRVPDDAELALDGATGYSLKGYVQELNLKRNPEKAVRVIATVNVIGSSAFVVSGSVESEPSSTP